MSLLPPNISDLEKAIVGAFQSVLDSKDLLIQTLWNADLCPYEFLPYLASALSVDFAIYNQLIEAEKREYIKKSIEIHRKKGSLGALKKALNIADYDIKVNEWYEYDGTPHTIKVDITKQSAGAFNIDLINNTINANKNVQTARVLSVKNDAYNMMTCGNGVTVTMRQDVPFNKAYAFIGCITLVCLRFK
ncbi:phage tail protein I [Cysteiniphilum halobium]|uniref:phage tail protein I n=1 Tax=Cysteiniphilum halobium TaxID=2219059 RepID=UPI003F869250